jgi:hypothetical protein
MRRRFVDMTPRELSGRLAIAKALPEGELQLVFGEGHPDIEGRMPEELRIHPIV